MAIELLARCGEWSELDTLAEAAGAPPGFSLQPFVDVLVEATFLERSDRPEAEVCTPMRVGTAGIRRRRSSTPRRKMCRPPPPEVADVKHRKKAIADPPPPMVKRVKAEARIELPSAVTMEGLTETLTGRRTWRKFGRRRCRGRSRDAAARHLGRPAVDGDRRRGPHGAQDVAVRRCVTASGLRARAARQGRRSGLYHYGADDHRLHRLSRRGAKLRKVSEYLPTQTWYDDVAVVIALTAVFARAQWRYDYAQAYRSILAEAGHLLY